MIRRWLELSFPLIPLATGSRIYKVSPCTKKRYDAFVLILYCSTRPRQFFKRG